MNTSLWNMDSGLAVLLRPGMTTQGVKYSLVSERPRASPYRYGSGCARWLVTKSWTAASSGVNGAL